MHPYRTHTCNELRASDAGKTVRLSGWMFRLRDHGGILFVDLRDHYGLTQIVVHPSRSFFGLVEKAHLESVITVTGVVKLRTPDTINPELPTGEIEIEANELVMESASQVTPLYIPEHEKDYARKPRRSPARDENARHGARRDGSSRTSGNRGNARYCLTK